MKTRHYESIRYGELADTASYTDRGWTWVPFADEPPADGELRINHRKGRQMVRDVYLLQEIPPVPGIMGRAFLMAKQTGNESPVYQTIIGPLSWCDCRAGKVNHTSCRHRDALAAMIADGVL